MNDQDWAHTYVEEVSFTPRALYDEMMSRLILRTTLAELKREITECINLSQISGENTKAQMRVKLLEAQRRIDGMIALQKDDPEMVKPKGEGK